MRAEWTEENWRHLTLQGRVEQLAEMERRLARQDGRRAYSITLTEVGPLGQRDDRRGILALNRQLLAEAPLRDVLGAYARLVYGEKQVPAVMARILARPQMQIFPVGEVIQGAQQLPQALRELLKGIRRPLEGLGFPNFPNKCSPVQERSLER